MLKKTSLKAISAILVLTLGILTLSGCGIFSKTGDKPATDDEIILNELGEEDYVQQTYSTLAEKVNKQETVYVNLTPEGSVRKVTVTDWLHTDAPQVRVADTSPLTGIHNVKTLTEPVAGDGVIYWDMDTTDLYYSGTSDAAPPLEIGIKYYINGQEIAASELAGLGGHITIEITPENTLKKQVTVAGAHYTVSCPMLLVGGMILPEKQFSNITVDNGISISDGSKQIVFFVGVPGIEESLGISQLNISLLDQSLVNDKYTVEADVDKFSIGNIMFAALPFSSIGSIGNGGLPETVDDVKDILSDVQLVSSAFKGLDMNRIISLLYGDTDKAANMLGAIKEAITLYSENEKLIKTLGSYMTDENLAKLDKLVTDLNDTDLTALSETLSDPAVTALLKLLPQLSSSVSEVTKLSADLEEVMPIFEAINKDMEDPEIQKSLENLPATLDDLKAIIAVIQDNKDLIEAIGDFASDDNMQKIDQILKTSEKYISMDDLSEAQAQALAGRMKEWLTFGSTYDIFTAKPDGARSSVVFTYKTDSVTIPEQ
ncbi:MAG: hypothetical protein K6G71_06090 [Clostridiales bacterium]|nr:hypothetical protein [Clostridiales bacterium]